MQETRYEAVTINKDGKMKDVRGNEKGAQRTSDTATKEKNILQHGMRDTSFYPFVFSCR